MDEDDVRSGQLVATGDATADERPVVDEELEIEAGSQPARVAVAAGGLVDAAEASTERHVRRLDRIEEQRPVRAPVLDEQEGRIAFELHQPEWRLETTDDRFEKVAGDDRGVLDLTPREVGGVARQVGDDQEASLGCRCHTRHARPWSRSNVKTLAASPILRSSDQRRGIDRAVVETLTAVLLILVAIAIVYEIARRIGVPYPTLLVLGGLALAFVPGLPRIQLEPDLVLFVFLPPLLFAAAAESPIRDLRANLAPLLRLSIGLVLFTMVVVAVVAHALVPGMSWPVAFTLGAIVGPTDALAATTVFRRLGTPRVIRTLIEGEALFNDATALVAYRAAVVAVSAGFVLSELLAGFAIAAVGGIAIGFVVGRVSGEILRRLDDPPVEVLISVVIPFAAYLPADRLGLSGVLAAVTAGLVIGGRLGTILTPNSRVLWLTTWKMIGFVLNGFVFVLIGLELPHILESLGNRPPSQLLGLAVAVSGVVVVGRIVWVFASSLLPGSPRRVIAARDPRLATRLTFVVSWAGLRGAVSLAAALALPVTFPERDLILFLTFAVILVTLVGQGLTLPRVLRWANWDGVEPEGDEAILARAAAYQAGLEEIQRAREEWPGHQPLFDRLESGLRDRTQHLATEDPDETAERTPGAGRTRGDPARRHRGPTDGRHRAARSGRDQRRDTAPDRARARPRRTADGGLTGRPLRNQCVFTPRSARCADPEGQGMGDKPMTATARMSRAEHRGAGEAARARVPLSDHGTWRPAPDRPDPIALLEEQAATRLPDLVPIRYSRMAASPFDFYRGAALPMAADLAPLPRSDIVVQLCGDAHLSNFGLFASPERTQVFDITDFDETLHGPFEWDLKRLATSLVLASRSRGFSEHDGRHAVHRTIRSYRTRMAGFATMRAIDVYYAQVDAASILGVADKHARPFLQETVLSASHHDALHELPKLTAVDAAGRRRSSIIRRSSPIPRMRRRPASTMPWPATATPSKRTDVRSSIGIRSRTSPSRSSASEASAWPPSPCCWWATATMIHSSSR